MDPYLEQRWGDVHTSMACKKYCPTICVLESKSASSSRA
jgi:hypothetical protein